MQHNSNKPANVLNNISWSKIYNKLDFSRYICKLEQTCLYQAIKNIKEFLCKISNDESIPRKTTIYNNLQIGYFSLL